MNKRISVIIPVYNAEKYISECVKSVQNQTYPYWELILIDDGSKDDSYAIIQEIAQKDRRIQVFHQENKGAGFARNLGLEWVTGNYIVFVDSDDYISPRYFELLAEHDEDIVFIDVEDVSDCKKVLNRNYMSVYQNCPKDKLIRSQMTGKLPWGGVRKAVKRNLIARYNIKYSHHKVGEEAIYSFQVLYFAKTVGFITEPVYYYVQRNNSLSHQGGNDPYGDVVRNLSETLKGIGCYEKYGNTLNAFNLTAVAVSAYQHAKNYSYLDFKKKMKIRRSKYYSEIDVKYDIDFQHMTLNAIIVGILLKIRMYLLIWCLSRVKQMIYR